jgi:hypothetical protein
MKSSTAMPRLQARAQSPRVTVPRQGAPTLKTEQSSALADSLKVSSQMRGQPGARQLSDKQVAAIFGLTVNGKQRGLRFTPGGQYVLRGKDFGSEPGTLFLQDPALGAVRSLHVNAWTDDAIYADLPSDISGAADVAKVLLVIAPKGKAAIENREFGFLAARESVELASLPPGAQLRLARVGPDKVPDPMSAARLVDSNLAAKTRVTQDGGRVGRSLAEERSICFEPGTDYLFVGDAKLAPGFEIDGLTFVHDERSGSGDYGNGFNGQDQGSRNASGRYAANWQDASAVKIDWAVYREHRSPNVLKGTKAHDTCESSYEIHLTASGPRGMKPL